jgi:hypothetical protein
LRGIGFEKPKAICATPAMRVSRNLRLSCICFSAGGREAIKALFQHLHLDARGHVLSNLLAHLGLLAEHPEVEEVIVFGSFENNT